MASGPGVRVAYDGLSMVKADLINRAAEATDLERWVIRDAVDVLLESVGAALERGDRVVLRRFGLFHGAPAGGAWPGIPGPTNRWESAGDGWCVSVPRRVSAASPTVAEGARQGPWATGFRRAAWFRGRWRRCAWGLPGVERAEAPAKA